MEIDFNRSQNLIVGATGSGKTTFTKKIIKRHKFTFGIIATSTPWEYSTIKNAAVIEFKDLDSYTDMLFKASTKIPKYVIIDNFIGIYKLNATVEKLFTQGRHFNIATFLLTQYAAKCPPVVRENARYIWVFRSCVKTYELLYNNQNKYAKKQDFVKFMQSKTGYSPILINNADLSLRDNILVL